MRATAAMAETGIARLRRRIAEIEGRPDLPAGQNPLLPFGVAALDRRLAGGLRHDALHEIRGATASEAVAAFGFAAAILRRLTDIDRRPLLVVSESAAEHETGRLYTPGLVQFGLDPRRLILVRTRRTAEALWVFEEALRCGGLAAVMAGIVGLPRQLDLTASRRLALRAGESGVMGLLLRQTDSVEAGAAMTRWHVAPRPAATLRDFASGIGRPVWRLALERNRTGSTGIFDLEWNHDEHSFALSDRQALSLHRPALSRDRPHPQAEARTVVAFPPPRDAARHRDEDQGRAPSRRAG